MLPVKGFSTQRSETSRWLFYPTMTDVVNALAGIETFKSSSGLRHTS